MHPRRAAVGKVAEGTKACDRATHLAYRSSHLLMSQKLRMIAANKTAKPRMPTHSGGAAREAVATADALPCVAWTREMSTDGE